MEGTVDLWIPSLLTVVDWKTVSVFGFSNLDVEGVSFDYQMQIHAYRHGIFAADPPCTHPDLPGMTKCLSTLGVRRQDIRAVLVYEAKDSDARKGVKAGQLKEMEVPYTDELEARYQARLEALHGLKGRDPFSVDGLPKDHWKCRTEKDGRPKYCPIGPVRGKCHQ
jgi:hypothetical protein